MDQKFVEQMPKLGFGLMRLPQKDGEIDIPQTCQMVDMFMEKGFTYFDTAYCYGDGASERAAKAALVDRYPRESFYLATKLPPWVDDCHCAEDAKQMFYTSLERTGAGYFDFYLLHNLGQKRTQLFEDYGLWDFLKELKQQGLIKHWGFSFHDDAEALDAVLTKHPDAEFVQLQINYIDWEDANVQSRRCYEVARRHGKPVVIMEPVKGGSLANPPESVQQVFRAAKPDVSCSSWAIRYAASLEGVLTVLSGMSDVQQMQDNLSTMSPFQPMDDADYAVIDAARAAFAAIPTIPCTKCGYCVKGCPMNINIPGAFATKNHLSRFANKFKAQKDYKACTEDQGKAMASACIECGRCEEVCPQHIAIREELKGVVEALEN